MLVADYLPRSNMMETSDPMVRPMIMDELTKLPSTNDDPSSITSIKIPLVSFEPILATSPHYILVNEFTRRRNQFVLIDDDLQKTFTRSLIHQSLLDALWYDAEQYFLLLTSTNIFTFDPNTKEIHLLDNFIPIENKTFKCFTLFNSTTLLIAYNEWGTEYIDKWQFNNENHRWKFLERQPLKLTNNEFIGNMLIFTEDNSLNLMITVYNVLTEQWRIDIHNTETFTCQKSILLPGSNIMQDYRIISIKNAQSDIKWLVYSSTNSNIIAIDSKWKKIQLNYKHPVQRMALFRENHLIVRTTERIDMHLFL